MEYRGAEWVRVDLHLHSPGVESFKMPSGIDINSTSDIEKVCSEYVSKLKNAGIRIAAITDYNGIRKEWFEPIVEKAKKEGIVVLPGIELSVHQTGGKYGIHVLVIFEDTVSVDNVNDLVKHFDKNFPHKELFSGRTYTDLESTYELEKLIEEIRVKYNCLIVFAHPDEDKGLCKTFSPKEAGKYLSQVKPDAIEYISDSTKQRLFDAKEIDSDFFGKIAVVENSDPKSLEDIGTKKRNGQIRATYVKLSDLSLDALKLALHDPDIRVRQYEIPLMYHDRIKRVSIKGTGFLRDVDIAINPEMNTLIGGRGVGKSALLESIRYCLDMPIYSDESTRTDFVHAVVGSGGEIALEIEKYYGEKKTDYRVRRIIKEDPEVFGPGDEILNLSPAEIFEKNSPVILGQKELYQVATDKGFLLKLVDELIGNRILEKQRNIYKLKEQLSGNARRVIELKGKLLKKDEYEQQLKTIEDRIKIYKELGVVDKLKKYTDLLEDEERLKTALRHLSEIIADMDSTLESSKERLATIMSSLEKGKSEGKKLLQDSLTIVTSLRKTLDDLKLLETFRTSEEELKNIYQKWDSVKTGVEKEMEDTKKKLGEEKLQPEILEQLTRQKAKVEPLLVELKGLQNQLNDLLKERDKLKRSLKDARYELFTTRQKEIDEINKRLKSRLLIKVIFKGENRDFKEKIKNLLKGAGIYQETIDTIIEREEKTIDGLMLSDYISQGQEKIKNEFGLTDKMAAKLIEWFKTDERLFELEILIPEDRIEIELNVDSKFTNIDKLSVGQKSTALLLLLFAQEDKILLLDQPEDDLDNRFIYEDVVQLLRELKGKRQLIIATHNANIPVLGDSEQIIVMDAESDACRVVERGAIDKKSIKDNVKKIMEGGEEAFLKRAIKYGGLHYERA